MDTSDNELIVEGGQTRKKRECEEKQVPYDLVTESRKQYV